MLKNDNFKTRDFSPLIEKVLAGVFLVQEKNYKNQHCVMVV